LASLAVAFASSYETKVKFINFQHKYQKSYRADEFATRFQIFSDNLARYEQMNLKAGKRIFGVNEFADLSVEEFSKFYLMPKSVAGRYPPKQGSIPAVVDNSPAPEGMTFDWNQKGVVTPVYNQQQCGSCWAFSATETIESYCALAGKGLQQLSMQQIVSCDNTADGCNGGWTYAAYEYVEKAGGIETYQEYPYSAESGSCQYDNRPDVDISGWSYVTESDENVMLNWVSKNGPVSVCVAAEAWQGYEAGEVMTASECSGGVDHCVQVTGYGTENGESVWNVRNSWGAGWGNQGYIWVQRGANACQIAGTVTAVTCS